MKLGLNGKQLDESSLVKQYMDLTGATEAGARSVFMYVCGANDEEMQIDDGLGMEIVKTDQPVRQWVFADGSSALARPAQVVAMVLLNPGPITTGP